MSNKTLNQDFSPAKYFLLDGDIIEIIPFGSGHINDTFKVTTDGEHAKSYLLQRINHFIFKDVDALMQNIDVVCSHLKHKLKHLPQSEIEKRTMTLVKTHDGSFYHQDNNGDYWRVFKLIEDTKSYDIVETKDQAYAGGKAFGQFQKQLADLDANLLTEVLPNFHNIDFRLKNLRIAIEENKANRASEVNDLLEYIFAREDKMRTVILMAQESKLPLRITHNDTKFNNVLLDNKDQVQCVIDLDTVMPGYVAYDFGDAIRTIINSAAEDESDLNKIKLNIPLFESYSDGYLSEAKDFLTSNEIKSLLYGVHLLPYMQAVRFLTDYLNGDEYYKIHYPNHNLIRTKSQLKLVHELEANHALLESILNKSMLMN